jgi:hypothetical protein
MHGCMEKMLANSDYTISESIEIEATAFGWP